MAEFPQPRFDIGQRVFDIQGRTGLVNEVFFAPAVNGYRYIVDGIVDVLEESELSDIPFGASEPIAPVEALRAALEIALVGNPGLDVRWWTGVRLGVPNDVLDDTPVQAAGGSLTVALIYWSERGYELPPDPFAPPAEPLPEPDIEPVAPVEPDVPALDQGVILTEVDQRIAQLGSSLIAASISARELLEAEIRQSISAEAELTSERFLNLESRITNALSRIENSLSVLEQAAQDATGADLRALLGPLGGFLANPLNWLLERAEDEILQEIIDGLNR